MKVKLNLDATLSKSEIKFQQFRILEFQEGIDFSNDWSVRQGAVTLPKLAKEESLCLKAMEWESRL